MTQSKGGSPDKGARTAAETLSVRLYRELCEKHDVKLNAAIAGQLSRGDEVDIYALDCSRTFLGGNGVRAIVDMLQYFQCVKAVDFTNNGIDTDVVSKIATLASSHQSLTSVSLSNNELSTPAARMLWEMTRQCRHIRSIDLMGTGLAEEWTTRINKQLAANADFCDHGYIHQPLPRSELEWTTLTILVLTMPGMEYVAEALDLRVVPKLNERFSPWRIRIAIAVHCEANPDASQVAAHLEMATDRYTRVPWVISVFGEVLPEAWACFVESSLLTVTRPVAPPLRNKHGEVRQPVRQMPYSLFSYIGPVPPRDVLDLTPEEKRRNEVFAAMRESPNVLCNDIVSMTSLEVRMATDLFNSVQVLYATTPMPIPEELLAAATIQGTRVNSLHRGSLPFSELSEGRTSDVADHRIALSILTRRMGDLCRYSSLPSTARPAELEHLLKYVERPVAGAAFPMVVYGSPGSGRSALMNHAVAALQYAHPEDQVILTYCAAEESSITTFLLFILHHFGTAPEQLGRGENDGLSFDHLQLAAANAIRTYSLQRKPIALFVKSADLLDHAWRVGGGSSVLWLPFSFPENVRIVLSVATESEFLHLMRQREQQPFDLLVRPVSRPAFITVLRSQLSRLHKSVTGVAAAAETLEYHVADQKGVIVEPRTVTGAIFQKQDADIVLYATLLASVLSLSPASTLEGAEPDVISLIRNDTPDTCAALATNLVSYLATMYGEKLTRDVACVICSCTCSLPEIIHFSETVYNNKRFSTLALIAHMEKLNLVRLMPSGYVRMAHPVIHKAVIAMYPPHALDDYRSKIAIDFTKSILERRHGFASMFCRVPDLLLHVGDVKLLSSLLIDVTLLDDLALVNPGVQVNIYDAYWRCIHHTEHLRDIQMEGFVTHQFVHSKLLDQLRRAISYFTQAKPNVWQSAVAMPFDSPLYKASVRAVTIPYPSAQRINKSYNENCSVWRRNADPSTGLRHCSLVRSIAAYTSEAGVVEVVDMIANQVIARETHFVDDVPGVVCAADLLGATVRDLDNILCIFPDRLVTWHWKSGEKKCFLGYTASLRQSAVRGDGNAAVAVDCATQAVVVLDLNTGRPLSQVPFQTDAVKEAHFVASDSVLVVGIFELCLCRPSGQNVHMVTESNHSIRAVASSPDATWIVAACGGVAHLFGSTGEILHSVDLTPHTILDVGFHPNGSLFTITSINGRIDVRHTLSGQQHRLLSMQVGAADFASFTPDGTKFVARCGTNLRMFDGTTFEDLGAVVAHDGVVRFLALDNTNIVTVCDHGEVKLWKTSRAFPSVSSMQVNSENSKNLVASGFVSKSPVQQIQVSPDNNFLVIRTADGTLTLWSFVNAPRDVPFMYSVEGVRGAFDFTSDGRLCYMTGPRTLVVKPLHTMNPTVEERLLPGDVENPTSWLVRCGKEQSLDGIACIAQYHNGMRMLVYDAKTLRLFVQFVGGHSTPVASAEFTQDAVVTAAADRRVCVWSLLSKAQRSEMLHSAPILTMTKLLNGSLLLSDADNLLLEFRVVGSDFIKTRSIRGTSLSKAVLPVAGGLVTVANGTSTVLLYDGDKGATVNHITAGMDVDCLAISHAADERYVFLGSHSGSVELFRLKGIHS